MTNAWNQLGETSPQELSNAFQQPYHLSQWLARFARGYLPKAEDDSHTNLQWRRDLKIMTTKELTEGGRRLSIGLNPVALSLLAIIDGVVADEFAADGRKDDDAGKWVKESLEQAGLDSKALDEPSPYEVPPSPYAGGVAYDAQGAGSALREMAHYYANADLVIAEATAPYRDIKPGPSPVRVWPHHFDIATTIALEEGDFETSRSIGAGLAVPDALCPEFYWYVYPWPNKSFNAMTDIGALEQYRLKDFSGLALPMSKVVNAGNQQGAVASFYGETIKFFMDMLQ